GPYRWGTSRHGAPVRVRQRIPFMSWRLLHFGGRPAFLPVGSSGSSLAHCSLVRSPRPMPGASHGTPPTFETHPRRRVHWSRAVTTAETGLALGDPPRPWTSSRAAATCPPRCPLLTPPCPSFARPRASGVPAAGAARGPTPSPA